MRWGLAPLVIFAAITSASAEPCPGDRLSVGGVLSAEHRWVAAVEQRDLAALDCILDPAFTDTSWRGELISKPEVLRRLPTRPPSTLTLSQLRATLIGNVAIVRGINTQANGGQSPASVRFVDIFLYRAHRWRAVSAQESLIQRQ